MMHNGFDDYQTGQFTPDIVVRKRDDNGHYEASSMGHKATHHDSAEAVNKLTQTLKDEIAKGNIYPGA